jgi:hypothetical protein
MSASDIVGLVRKQLANYYYLFLKAPNVSLQYFVVPI